MKTIFSFVLLILVISSSSAQVNYKRNSINESINYSKWIQTNGPGGGFVSDIVFDPYNSSTLYAIGTSEGIYKSIDSGNSWDYLRFQNQAHASDLEISSSGSGVLFSNHFNLSKSLDGGVTWIKCNDPLGKFIGIQVFKVDPINPDIIYAAGNRFDGKGIEIFKSGDLGDSWIEITNGLETPFGSSVSSIGLMGDGKLFIGINDNQLTEWHNGKVFYTDNDGGLWSEVNFGQTEDRYIYSIYINSQDHDEIWISEGPLYNTGLSVPYVYYSKDGGSTWHSVFAEGGDASQARVIGNSNDGNLIYFGLGGSIWYTGDFGLSLTNMDLPSEIMRSDINNITMHPSNPDFIFLPTGSGGVAFTENNGKNWIQKNEGILNTSINLLAADPFDPGRIYCASWIGEGIFRTDDYGQNWKYLNKGGILHPWDDELVVDPTDPSNVWFISDVPYLHHSKDFGNTWELENHPYEGGSLNFNSIYSIAQSSSNQVMYALNNGFGIYRGTRTRDDESFNWNFLNLSEVDYSYSLAVEPENSDIIYSGYSRKPFETKAKIRGSYDGGQNWFTALEVDSAEAVTSVVIDPLNISDVYAASVGETGGQLWKSENKGQDWQILNDYFNFTTIHSFATPIESSQIAYAGVWGGGTYKTEDSGDSWEKLEGPESFSAAAMAVDPNDPKIIYLADRTLPILYKSIDSGESWSEFFNAGPNYRRLMSVTVEPDKLGRVYVSAMKMGGPGKLGSLFRIDDSSATDITGILPRLALTLTVDPDTSSILYVVLHETGVFKSTDTGNTWIDISGESTGLPESGFNNLIIDPNDSDKLYLLGGCDVRFETFESAGLDPDIVNGIYLSEDGGLTWENVNNNVLGEQSGPIKSLMFYSSNSDLIYLGTENGVYYSTNGNHSWIKSDGLPFHTLGGIAISGNTIYAYTNGAGLFKGSINEDYSITWESDQKITTEVYFAQLIKDKINSSVIYASGYPGGIFKSTDNGDTWHEKNFGMVSFHVDDPLRQGYYALSQSNSNPDVFYLGLYEKGVYRSSNAGETWYPVNGPIFDMANKRITSVAIDNEDENTVYIGSEEGVYKTNNGGQSWLENNQGLSSKDVKILYMNNQNQLFAGTRGYGLYQLISNHWEPHHGFGEWGVNWPIWDSRPMYQYTSLLIHSKDHSRMIMGTFPQGIYKSDDGGNNWKESNIGWTNDGVFYLTCHPNNPEIVYAGTYNGINRSLDFGKSWQIWDSGIPPEQWVFSIDFDPTNPDIMYACSKNGEKMGQGREGFRGTVVKTLDGGKNWIEITNGLVVEDEGLTQEFYKIIVDRFNPNILYLAAQHEGIYISKNGGESWESGNEGLNNNKPGVNGNNVTNTMVLSADNSMLYFGTSGSGVWRRMIAPILAVNNLSAKLEDHTVSLSWEFEDFNNSFRKYNVYRSEDFIDSIEHIIPVKEISSITDTLFTDQNIIPGKQYFYVVTAEDGSGYENPYFYTLGPIVDAPVQIQTEVLDSGQVGVNYADTIIISGGLSPYTIEVYNGDLPQGLSMDENNGIIYGIPIEKGTFSFSIVASDNQTPSFRDSCDYEIFIENSDPSKIDPYLGLSESIRIFPNPFSYMVTIEYRLNTQENIRVEIINTSGEVIRILENSNVMPGTHTIEWDGTDNNGTMLNNGIYYLVVNVKEMPFTRKIAVLRSN